MIALLNECRNHGVKLRRLQAVAAPPADLKGRGQNAEGGGGSLKAKG